MYAYQFTPFPGVTVRFNLTERSRADYDLEGEVEWTGMITVGFTAPVHLKARLPDHVIQTLAAFAGVLRASQ